MILKFRSSSLLLIILIFIAFIALGMPDGLLGVGWPSIRSGFGIPLDALGALMLASAIGYFTSSFFSGRLLNRLGIGWILVTSCSMTGMALIGYTLVPAWWMMVVLGVFSGLGAGAIDAGLNTHVADNFNEGIMQWLHASYGIGITMGPIIMSIGLNNSGSWRSGYTVVGIFQLVLALCFAFSLNIWNHKSEQQEKPKEKKISEYHTPLSETLQQPAVWLSLLLFIVYVGVEMSLGVWTYTLLTESRGVSTRIAGYLSGSFYATFTIGRMLAGFYARRIGLDRLILSSIAGALAGSILLWANLSDAISVAGVALVGFAIAPIFGGMVSGTSRRVGPNFAANTIGMQMSACSIGGTFIPWILGALARYISLEAIPAALCVLLLVFLLLYRLSIQLSINREAKESTELSHLTIPS